MSNLELMTPEELCEELKGAVGLRTLQNWRRSGKGPGFIMVGRTPRYLSKSVDEWLKAKMKENNV